MTYKVTLKPLAEKQLAKLLKDIQKRLFAAFVTLADNPRPYGPLSCKTMPIIIELEWGIIVLFAPLLTRN